MTDLKADPRAGLTEVVGAIELLESMHPSYCSVPWEALQRLRNAESRLRVALRAPQPQEENQMSEYREGLYRRGFKAGFEKAITLGRASRNVSLDTLIKVEQHGIDEGLRRAAIQSPDGSAALGVGDPPEGTR